MLLGVINFEPLAPPPLPPGRPLQPSFPEDHPEVACCGAPKRPKRRGDVVHLPLISFSYWSLVGNKGIYIIGVFRDYSPLSPA